MDEQLAQKLEEHTQRLEMIYQSVEKTRKYFLTTLIITVVVFVLPLLGLFFAIPAFLESYSSALEEF